MMSEDISATEREDVACNICGALQPLPLFDGQDPLTGEPFTVARCRTCGLCYVNPRPPAERMADHYSEAYYGTRKRHPFLADSMMALRARKLPGGTPARLLDVGCGRGDFMLHCRRHGWTVTGVEQGHAPVMALKAAFGIDVYELHDLGSIPPEHFDVVTIWHVLEHLPDPAQTLAQVRRILKPGGLLLIEVPNFGGWQGRFGGTAWFQLEVPRHLFHFEKPSLERLLVQQGLAPYRWQTFSLEYDTFSLAQTVLNRICSRPNHLFQMLIRERDGRRRVQDSILSIALLPFLVALGLPVSVAAAACGQGGVLRVWARK